MLAAHGLKEMPTFEDIFDPRRELRITHPIELYFAQALSADRTGTQILPVIFAQGLGAFYQLVEGLIERAVCEIIAVEVKHLKLSSIAIPSSPARCRKLDVQLRF